MSETQPQAPEAAPAAKRKVRTPGAAQAPEAAPAVDTSDAGLPNAIDIDPRKITGPVLTKQGWVVPDAEYISKQRKFEAMRKELGEA
jgi:hypothetical protein